MYLVFGNFSLKTFFTLCFKSERFQLKILFFKKSKGSSYVQPLCSYYMKLQNTTDARSCIVSFNLLKEELGISSGFIVQLKVELSGNSSDDLLNLEICFQ